MVFSAMVLNPLNDGGDTHAATDAQCDQRAPRVAALELVDHGAGDHGAGGAQRVTHRDGPTVDVELLVRDVEVLLELQPPDRNAAFRSNKSMSWIVSPERSSTLRVAGVGPVSMITGSEPLVAVATMRARGVRPCDLPAASEPIMTSAAPSTIPELLPPVCTWLIFSTQWYFCSATSSKPPIAARPSKAGFSLARPSAVVSGRMCSSWSRISKPFWSRTGTTDLAKYPPDHASAAFS